MPFEHLPSAPRARLAELNLDAMRAQQFLDLLGNRAFRNTLLCAGRNTPHVPDPIVVNDCAIGFHMFPADGRVDLAPGAQLRLEGPHSFAMTMEDPAQKAFFAALCEAAPGRIHFRGAIERAAELLRISGINTPLDDALLRAAVLKLFTADQLDLVLAGSGEWLRSSTAPSPLMRWQATNRFIVTNRWHQGVTLADDDRRWIAGEQNTANKDALLRTGLCG